MLVAAVLMLFASCSAPQNKVTIMNGSRNARLGEMIEVEASQFSTTEGVQFVVRNEKGEEIPSQLTYDGLLIFQCDVEARGEVTYTVEVGTPAEYQNYAVGRVYPERVDDVAWESDLIAYRAYGPALQQSGERAFGYDVWVKNNTSLPVVAERYEKELNADTKARIASLRESDPAAADELYASVSYHNDHGNGFDAYKVGPTLGGGATAIVHNETIVYPYCYKECEILDNGPLRFTAKLTYNPTVVGERELREVRTISIDKGAFLNRTTVVYEGAEGEVLDVMAGIVLHEQEPRTLLNEQHNYMTYAEVVEAPDGGELYQALYFPNGWSGAENRTQDAPAGTFGHAAVYNKVAAGEPMTYYWGALWSRSTEVAVADKAAFDALMKDVVAAKRSPLRVITVVYEKEK